MVSVPMELPGDSVPPEATVTVEPAPAPIVPEPPSMPPAPTLNEPPSLPSTASLPPLTTVRPVKPEPSPARRRTPAPALSSSPLPDSVPASPSVVPAATSMPPECVTVTGRDISKDAVVASVPPSSASPPAEAPRFASRSTCSVPPAIVVPPVYVLSPPSTSVPAPALTSALPSQPVAALAAWSASATPTSKRSVGFVSVKVPCARLLPAIQPRP
ncbi:hypothetical protein D9M72_232540 [compost metagenome]